MKNEKMFVRLLFSFSMFAVSFVFWGNIQNAQATTAQCNALSGASCVVSSNGFCPSGQDSILTITCDNPSEICCAPTCTSGGGVCSVNGSSCPIGSTPISGYFCSGGEACCTAPPQLVCCQISADTCAENTSGLCPGSIIPIPGSCSDVSTCPQYVSPDVSDPVDDGSGSTSPDVSDPVIGCSDGSAICFASPLAFKTVEGVLNSILGTLQGIIVLISIVFIVIGAVMYITSAGNDKQIGMAKNAITASMIGLAIGIAAPSFLREISTILGWGVTDACSGITDPAALQICQDTYNNSPTLAQIATNVLNFLLAIVGVLGIIMLVIGGATYLTSAGSDKKIDTAKAITKWAIVGIVVALAAMVLVKQIARFFV